MTLSVGAGTSRDDTVVTLGTPRDRDDAAPSVVANTGEITLTGSNRLRIIVMGPSGAGKSAVGAALAARLGVPFVDADDLHPPANVAKMTAGIPLDDADRMPWLDLVGGALAAAPGMVIACSALARRYRDRLRAVASDVRFVELQVARDELDRRMRGREHFMPTSLLDSQLQILEHLAADEPGVAVLNAGSISDVAERAATALGAQSLR